MRQEKKKRTAKSQQNGTNSSDKRVIKRKGKLPCDNHGVVGCQSAGCAIWLK